MGHKGPFILCFIVTLYIKRRS